MYILYVDESGVPERSAQSDHYALAGVAIPSGVWARKRDAMDAIRGRYGLSGREFHTAWMMRPYPEQVSVPGFDAMGWQQRRDAVLRERARILQAIEASGRHKVAQEKAAFYRKTKAYVHLNHEERRAALREVASLLGSWSDATLFGEVARKNRMIGTALVDETYQQLASRFEAFLSRCQAEGIVACDQNESAALRLTQLTDEWQRVGGRWRQLRHVAGHPFFVASHESDLVQMADLVAYSLRRYCEREETDLLQRFFGRFDRLGQRLVGLRHYRGNQPCDCMICAEPR